MHSRPSRSLGLIGSPYLSRCSGVATVTTGVAAIFRATTVESVQRGVYQSSGRGLRCSVPAHKEGTMPVYMVYVCHSVSDRAQLETYWASIAPTLDGVSIKFLAGYTPFEVLE